MDPLKAIDIKVFASKGDDIDPYEFVGVLQRWIREHTVDGILIDVADYSHIHHGPGVVLVGHEGNISIDYDRGRMGMLYRYRQPAEPDNAGRIAAGLRYVLDAAEKLQNEPEFQGRLEFDKSSVAIISNDRLNGPNTDEAYTEFAAEIGKAVDGILDGATFSRVNEDPRERLTAAT